jgi:peptidyl-prolyl cis-trans isomerase SurA
MMFCRNYLSKVAHALFAVAILATASPAFAQVSNPSAVNPDSKIRDIDGVVAVVNTGFISRKEIDDRVATIVKQSAANSASLPSKDVLRKQVLEQLIVEKVQLQEAQQTGISVSDAELDKIIADIAARNKLSVAAFREAIIKSGSTFSSYRDLLRNDVIVTRFREREVDAQIKISEAEVDNYISERTRAMSAPAPNQAGSGGQEEIDVAQIFIPVDANAGPAAISEARKQADALLREARGDVDFLQLGAKAAKENPRIKFQSLGYRTPDRLPQIFLEAVRNLGSGQLAPSVVKSAAGFHVLKVLDRRVTAPTSQPSAQEATGINTPKNITITETMARHILLRNRAGLTDADAERRLSGYRDQVRAKAADFGELAKKHSEDGSAPNGGVLGWMSPGQLVPEFEFAMNRLQVGEVSNPVKTEFGWHLIQVLERRDAQLTVEKQREFARAAIRERKFEQLYQDWLRQLRDTATVRILNVDNATR